jgi:two-component sensor histidine kinase
VVELLNYRKDGATFWVELSIVPVADETGWFTHWVSVQRDVSDRKTAEEAATRARVAEAEREALRAEISERRRVEERQTLLTRELDHRAKNALAVVQAALRLTPREDAEAFARAVEGRVAALSRAHTLLAKGRWDGAELGALAEGELAPFLAGSAGDGPRAELSGPPLSLSPNAAQALSMALHELATNAVKHGALSVPGGRVSLRWSADDAAGLLRLRWAEAAGPLPAKPPTRRGFGSRVLEATLRVQLGGVVVRSWEAPGLVCEAALPLPRVLAGGAAAADLP